MKKLSRRGMLGTVVGGALAGPSLVRDAASNTGQGWIGPPSTPAPYYGESLAKQADQKAWTLEQLAKIKRIASGDIRDEDRNYPTEGNPQPFRELRSVSENAKQFMRGMHYERQWRERAIKSALDALNHYDQTGILRTFF